MIVGWSNERNSTGHPSFRPLHSPQDRTRLILVFYSFPWIFALEAASGSSILSKSDPSHDCSILDCSSSLSDLWIARDRSGNVSARSTMASRCTKEGRTNGCGKGTSLSYDSLSASTPSYHTFHFRSALTCFVQLLEPPLLLNFPRIRDPTCA